MFKFSVLFFLLTFLFRTASVNAKMQSDSFEIHLPNLNYTAGSVESDLYKLGFTGGELAVGTYSSSGYKLKNAGFWQAIIPFSFTVSNNVIEFDVLSANEPRTATTDLIVSAGGSGGYQVTAEENQEMIVFSVGAKIPDVTGDNGDITEETAGEWLNNDTYGFGYSIYGNDVLAPFPATLPDPITYFKQFANMSIGETPQTMMISDRVGRNRTATVVYKINISTTQAAGRYQNVITYIAIPTY